MTVFAIIIGTIVVVNLALTVNLYRNLSDTDKKEINEIKKRLDSIDSYFNSGFGKI